MSQPRKVGKVATKGVRQIVDENEETRQFYLYMIGGTFALNTIYLVMRPWDFWAFFLHACLGSVLIGAYKFLHYLCKVKRNERGDVIEFKGDLNQEGGTAEHAKDLIIVICASAIFSLAHTWFWWMLIAIPLRVIVGAWTGIIKPWFLASDSGEADGADGADAGTDGDKRQRRQERKMAKKMR